MKTLHFAVLALASVAACTSCKKDKTEEPGRYGPANTMTVDGAAKPITVAHGWTLNMGYDQEALGVGLSDGGVNHWLTIGIAHDAYGSDHPLSGGGKYWEIGYMGHLEATGTTSFFYECYHNDDTPKITGGHVYIKRTGAGDSSYFGAFILRFDISFADGRRVYGNYSGNFIHD